MTYAKKQENDLKSENLWIYYLTFAAHYVSRQSSEARKQGHTGGPWCRTTNSMRIR